MALFRDKNLRASEGHGNSQFSIFNFLPGFTSFNFFTHFPRFTGFTPSSYVWRMKIINLCFACMLAVTSLAQTTLPEAVVESIQSRIDLGMNPSIAIGVLDDSGVHYYNFGLTKAGGKTVDEHTIYEIGSITKTFTGILLADATLNGLVAVDDPAQKYLPDAVHMPEFDGDQITLGHLSDHTSSMPRMPDNFEPADPTNPYADYSTDRMYDFVNSCELTREIGSEFEYSNLAQGLLGHILALRSGKDYETILRETILKPLKMNETAITFTKPMRGNLAQPHTQGAESANWDLNVLAGAGAIRSSVHDMLLYLKANLGLAESELNPAMEMSHQQRHTKAGQGIGLGWFINPAGDGEVLSHGGATGGYNAFAGFNKTTGQAVVVLTNSDAGIGDIGMHLMDPDAPLRPIWPHVARELRRILDEDGVSGLDQKYEKLRKEKADFYDFSEDEINTLGYYYLGLDNVDAALAIFKINTIEHPESFNVWDSYAEGLKEKGDTAQSIAY
jgi:CubicO group peptidase (beta-lactamase class C family)